MTSSSRVIRVVWFMGIVLLLGTAIGAGWIFAQPVASKSQNTPAEPPMLGIVGLGFFDVEEGISFLHPLQSGRVATVFVKEGDTVKEGDLLISLDNGFQKTQLRRAEAALATAKSQLLDAEDKLVKKWKHEIEIQKTTLNGAREKLKAAETDEEIGKEAYKLKNLHKLNLDQYAQKVEMVKAEVRTQEILLDQITDMSPQGTIDRAKADVKEKEANRDNAKLAVFECDLYAPADGTVLRLFANAGEFLNGQPRQLAVHFCPDSPRVVRVEVLQEWASKIKEGQPVDIEDDSRSGVLWKGKVERVGKWFSPRRSVIQEPFQFNDIRTLECIVSLEPGSTPIRIGQRVRAIIKQGGP